MSVRIRNLVSALALSTITGAAFVVLSSSQPASAVPVELAKKCREMAAKANPPDKFSSKGAAVRAQQEYYRTCLDNDGRMS